MRLRAPVSTARTRSRPKASSIVRFRGRQDLVLLWIDPARVRAEIKYEEASDGSGTFPHIYGPLDIDAVARVTEYREHNGTFPTPN